jgi:predicted alpha-1,2-mannosidase
MYLNPKNLIQNIMGLRFILKLIYLAKGLKSWKMKNSVRLIFILVILFLAFNSCISEDLTGPASEVNPFIGTGGHGHTFPGAVVPFGMVQLSPDTKIDDWDHCSGYHYSDSVILGFSHTHLSGTGIGDYGDVRFMPYTGKTRTQPGTQENPDQGYASRFSHKKEKAVPGYYSVELEDYKISVELTATERAGIQRYLFPETKEAHIIVDLKEAVTTEQILGSHIKVIDDHTIAGMRRTNGWARNHYVYFYTKLSKPFKSFRIYKNGKVVQGDYAEGNNIKLVLDYETAAGENILVKTGISAVDTTGAQKNLATEIAGWDFDKVKEQAYEKWNRQLKKIEISGGTKEERTVFYTALYHTMIAPNIYSDVDFRYRGHDQKIHQDSTFTMYTVFSLWDTFRALHPLFTIIERKRTEDLIRSMLDFYDHDGHLPVWELAADETFCMIGYNSVPVIADAYRKGITGFDIRKALTAMVKTADANRYGLKIYRTKGYIPSDKESESVSKTLEYAYDDWCIAQTAKMAGDKKVYDRFIQRGQYYKNLFDKQTGFFRPKANGAFTKPFDPKQVNFNYTEANAWQYGFFVPQDVNTLIGLVGGDKAFSARLDELFSTGSALTGRQQADITGLIGQYAHGNEPSHHIAYLYNFSGDAWKTQEKVNRIMHDFYKNTPDGLIGNEDCGQMSAWYVLSAMGFYPVTPGTDVCVMGTPLFDKGVVRLENGKTFKVVAKNRDQENLYISSVKINDSVYTRSYITHEMIMDGSVLEFEMSDSPNKEFGSKPADRPVTKITDKLITPVPYFDYDQKTFKENLKVSLGVLNPKAQLFYKKGNRKWKNYEKPLDVKRSGSYSARAVYKGKKSFTETASFTRIPQNRKITIKTKYSPQYTAGGDEALINTIRGGRDFRTGNWQGYEGNDVVAVVDLGKKQKIRKIGMGFLQDQNAWVFMPQWVEFEVSTDGKTFKSVGKVVNKTDPHLSWVVVKDFTVDNLNEKARYIRVHAKNRGTCPSWHKGYPGKSWIFTDEIWVK